MTDWSQMAKLTYAAIASLDGYVEDEEGKFDWAMPDEEVHAFVNDLERPLGTYLVRLTGPAMRRQAKARTRVNRC
jgi:hypothetical protein